MLVRLIHLRDAVENATPCTLEDNDNGPCVVKGTLTSRRQYERTAALEDNVTHEETIRRDVTKEEELKYMAQHTHTKGTHSYGTEFMKLY